MRRRTERRLSDEDVALWSHVARSVRVLPGRGLSGHGLSTGGLPEEAMTMQALLDGQTDGGADAGGRAGAIASAPPGPQAPANNRPAMKPILPLDRRLMTALKRGRAPLEAVLDLHGLRQTDAQARLVAFLRRAQGEGARVVLVITGKGAAGSAAMGGLTQTGSAGDERGVLRRVVPHWLRLPELRSIVLGFEEASLHHGGGGALYVRLRKARGDAPGRAP